MTRSSPRPGCLKSEAGVHANHALPFAHISVSGCAHRPSHAARRAPVLSRRGLRDGRGNGGTNTTMELLEHNSATRHPFASVANDVPPIAGR